MALTLHQTSRWGGGWPDYRVIGQAAAVKPGVAQVVAAPCFFAMILFWGNCTEYSEKLLAYPLALLMCIDTAAAQTPCQRLHTCRNAHHGCVHAEMYIMSSREEWDLSSWGHQNQILFWFPWEVRCEIWDDRKQISDSLGAEIRDLSGVRRSQIHVICV